jgi:GNAT superfamily N-acetyltransferase
MTAPLDPTASVAELAAAADANFALHASWVARHVAGMRVDELDGLTVVDAGLATDTFNVACHAQLDATAAPTRIAAVVTHFASAGRPFSWWVGPADQPADLGRHLIDAGLHADESSLAMAANLASIPPAIPVEGLEVRRVTTPAELEAMASIVAANWSPPDADVGRYYRAGASVLLAADSPIRFYVGYHHGIPVATAEATVAGGVVGLYGICTLPASRRRGIGTAMTVAPLLAARDAGLRTGILQASTDGAGIYAAVGFGTYGTVREYKPAS